MTKFLYNLLLMSVSGTVMFLLATLMYRQTKSKYARWYYALLITAAALFILPLQEIFSIPKAVTVELPRSISVYTDSGTSLAGGGGVDVSYIIFALWAAGAAAFITFNTCLYIRTYRALMAASRITLDTRVLSMRSKAAKSMKIKKDIRVRKSDTLRSPLLFGVIKPVIILPDMQFSESELNMIFTHELTHYRHKDLLIKLMTIFVSSIHWFNPCVYIMKKAINNGCELCCDETVLSILNLKDKKDYGRLLLAVIENGNTKFAYTTAMSVKQSIQQRLKKIVEFKRMSLPIKMISVMAALSMTVCSVTAFGFDIAKETLPDSVSKVIDKALNTTTDVSGAYLPKETEKPVQTDTQQQTETPVEITEEAMPEDISDNYIEENDETVSEVDIVTNEPAEEYIPPENHYTSALSDTAVPTEAPEEIKWKTYEEKVMENGGYYVETIATVELPKSSYMFNPKFSVDNTAKIYSSLITVTEDCYMRIAASGSEDLHYELYNSKDELLLTDTQIKNAKIPVKKGECYYIAAESDTPQDAHIYVYVK